MLKVGLTGGIACGKSTVLAMFAELGHTRCRRCGSASVDGSGEVMYERIVARSAPAFWR